LADYFLSTRLYRGLKNLEQVVFQNNQILETLHHRKQLKVRPNNKKNTWLPSHSHKFSGGGGRFLIFNSIFLGGWGRFFHHIGDIFCTDVAKATILI
jgi:hypothetical protein